MWVLALAALLGGLGSAAHLLREEIALRLRANSLLLVPLLLSILSAGCATAPKRTDVSYQADLRKVALVSIDRIPEIHLQGFARGKAEGAVNEAKNVFGNCMVPAGSGGGADAGFILVLQLAICTVATPVGAVVGAASAPNAEQARASENTMSAAVAAAAAQSAFVEEVRRAGTDRVPSVVVGEAVAPVEQALSEECHRSQGSGVDAVLAVEIVKVETAGSGVNGPLQLTVTARARLLRTGDCVALLSREYQYMGPAFTLEQWSESDGARLRQALSSAYELLGAHIYDYILCFYPFPDHGPHAAGVLSSAFGLAPIYPRNRLTLTGSPFGEWTTVDSLQPTIRWEAFPRKSDIAAAPDDMARVRDVRYDLVIAREGNLAPEELIYRKEGLLEPVYTVERPLDPAKHYFWTVRARFELDGRERITEWATTVYSAREQLVAPSRYGFRFQTP